MRILVDHGSLDNFGDAAMLAGVCEIYGERQDCQISIVDRGQFPAMGLPRRRIARESAPRLTALTSRILPRRVNTVLYRTPLAWRYVERINRAVAEWSVRPRYNQCAQAAAWTLRGESADRSLAHVAKRFDALHLAGGGYLTDEFPGILFEKCCLVHAFAAADKPVLMSGQQIGPFRGAEAREAVYRALRRATFIGLREPLLSANHCVAAGLSERQFAVTGDDSFGVAADVKAGRQCLDRLGLQAGEFIAINYRHARYAGSSTRGLERFAKVCLAAAMQCRLPLLFVPIARNAMDSDEVTGERLLEKMRGMPCHLLATRELGVEDVKGVLSLAAAALGTSYHFATFARSCGVPAISLSTNPYYDQKARGLAAFWVTGVWAESLRNADADNVARQVALMMNSGDRDALEQSGADAAFQWRQRLQARVETIAKALSPVA